MINPNTGLRDLYYDWLRNTLEYDADSDLKPISWEEYGDFTSQGAFYPGAGTGNKDELSYLMCSLGGEVGEVLNVYKKVIRDEGNHTQGIRKRTPKIFDELGDVLWYISQLTQALNLPFEALLIYNTVKLCERHNMPWPYENLEYADALKLMQRIEFLITNPNATTSMDTDTLSKQS